MTSTFFSRTARDAARLMAVVVFPTPPFWLAIAMTFPISSIYLAAVAPGAYRANLLNNFFTFLFLVILSPS